MARDSSPCSPREVNTPEHGVSEVGAPEGKSNPGVPLAPLRDGEHSLLCDLRVLWVCHSTILPLQMAPAIEVVDTPRVPTTPAPQMASAVLWRRPLAPVRSPAYSGRNVERDPSRGASDGAPATAALSGGGTTTPASPLRVVVAAALLRRGDDVLLVRQGGAARPATTWELPGGGVEPGELPTEAAVREVREETGLEAGRLGGLLYAATSVDPVTDDRFTVYVFRVAHWSGSPDPAADPSGTVVEAAFVPLPEALARLATHPWPLTREPVLAHLRGEAAPGALWLYHERAGGLPLRVAVVEPARA